MARREREIHRASFVIATALAAATLISALIIVSGLGLVRESLILHGPFQTDGIAGSQKLSAPVPPTPLSCCTFVRTDANGSETASRMRLWLGERELQPAHVEHEVLRHGGAGFSHWGASVNFVLPAGMANTRMTTIRIEYPIEPAAPFWLAPLGTLSCALALLAISLIRGDAGARRRIVRGVANGALVAGVMLCLGVIALQSGALLHTETYYGPFTAENQASSRLSVPVNDLRAMQCCLRAQTDTAGSETSSELRFWINGREITPPHTLHDTLRHGGAGFSHWGNAVYFALPPGAQNSVNTQVRLTYPVRPQAALAVASVGVTLALALVLYWRFLPLLWRAVRSSTSAPLISAAKNVALALAAAATLVVIIMSLGLVQETQTLRGPFSSPDNPSTSFVSADVDSARSWRCCTAIGSDGNTRETVSRLRLWLNGREITPAHMEHAAIRAGAPGFSHWGNSVYFALPANATNTAQTSVRIVYPLQPPLFVGLAIPAFTLWLAFTLHRRRILAWSRGTSRSLALAAKTPYHLLYALCAVLAVGVAVYATLVAQAALRGDALPLATPFQPNAMSVPVRQLDPALPLIMLLLCTASAIWAQLLSLNRGSRIARHAMRREEIRFTRWFARLGFVFVLAWLFASIGATWAGITRAGSSQGLMGLMPFFDAYGYYSDLHVFAREGVWVSASTNRPIAAAARTALFYLSGERYPNLILLQATAVAGALYWAALSVLRWRGVWACLAVLALGYIQVRVQIPTLMTEPIGQLFAFLSVPFLVHALRTRSPVHGALAIAFFTLAMWARLGAALTPAALVLWYGWQFGTTWLNKIKYLALGACIVVSILALNAIVGALFTHGVTNNYAYNLCAMSLGDPLWNRCSVQYADEIARLSVGSVSDPHIMNRWMEAKALANIHHDPRPIAELIAAQPLHFMQLLPSAMLRGYTHLLLPQWFPTTAFLLACVALSVATFMSLRSQAELWFWSLVFLSTLGSTPVTFASDGVRVFAVSYVLLIPFFAFAFATPFAALPQRPKIVRQRARAGVYLALAVCAAMIIIPLVGRILGHPAPFAPSGDPHRAIVASWPFAATVLVVPDGTPLPRDTPAVTESRFRDAYSESGLGQLMPVPEDFNRPAPFAVGVAPRVDGGETDRYLVLPANFALHHAPYWRITIAQGSNHSVSTWAFVTEVTPVGSPAPQQ